MTKNAFSLAKVEQTYKESVETFAKKQGIRTVHIFNKEFPKGGLTVAFAKVKPDQVSTNMVLVAVATCSMLDSFCRKTGTFLALSAYYDGEVIALPLSSGYADEDLPKRVKNAFEALYRSSTVY